MAAVVSNGSAGLEEVSVSLVLKPGRFRKEGWIWKGCFLQCMATNRALGNSVITELFKKCHPQRLSDAEICELAFWPDDLTLKKIFWSYL